MFDYLGVNCPICEKPFQQDDDIVVCPQCGAPYHRDCYNSKGHCMYEDGHATGTVWKPPAPKQAQPAPVSSEVLDKECPLCGTLNAQNDLFCKRCGGSLTRNEDTSGQQQMPPFSSPFSANGVQPFPIDPMGGVRPSDVFEDDVNFGDLSKIVKQNTIYYMPVFKHMKQHKRNRFNFCAFLFSGGWMLYRKQYKLGTIFTLLLFILQIASICFSVFISQPVLIAVMNELGYDSSSLMAFEAEQLVHLSTYFMERPFLYFQFALPLICRIIMLGIMIFTGIKGNKLYMKHCYETIRKIKQEPDQEDRNEGYEIKGGVNFPIAVCLLVCYMILTNVPAFM